MSFLSNVPTAADTWPTVLDRDRMRLWAEALESDEFEQGQGCLRDDVRKKETDEPVYQYCCLGVAIEIALRNGCKASAQLWGMDYSTMWREVARWYGLHHDNPTVGFHPDDGSPVPAVIANDDMGWSFDQIAEGIRKIYLNEEPNES